MLLGAVTLSKLCNVKLIRYVNSIRIFTYVQVSDVHVKNSRYEAKLPVTVKRRLVSAATSVATAATVTAKKNKSDYNYPKTFVLCKEITKASHCRKFPPSVKQASKRLLFRFSVIIVCLTVSLGEENFRTNSLCGGFYTIIYTAIFRILIS